MARPGRKIEYPCCDGHPMTDKDINRLLMEYTELAIRSKFRHHPTGYVSANLFIYYGEGKRKKRVAPDTFFVKGATKELRDVYVLSEERLVPDVAFEYVARTSYRLDPETKRVIYEGMGIPEYYVFDPKGKWLHPPLRAYLMGDDGHYQEILVHGGEIASPRLGLTMRVEGQWLRFYDTDTGEPMQTADEAQVAALREAERAGQEAVRAEQEAVRAEQEAVRAEHEALRADRAEERLRVVERELERLRGGVGLPPW